MQSPVKEDSKDNKQKFGMSPDSSESSDEEILSPDKKEEDTNEADKHKELEN